MSKRNKTNKSKSFEDSNLISKKEVFEETKKESIKDINTYETLQNCKDEGILNELLQKQRTKIQTEEILVKILEDNIKSLSEEIIKIEEKGKIHVEQYIKENEERRKELEEKYIENNNKLEEERQNLEKEHQEKLNSLEEDFKLKTASLENSFKEKEDELTNKTKELENNYQEKEKALKELEEKTLEDYKNKEANTIQEYKEKEENIIASYNEKEQNLLNDIKTKEEALENEKQLNKKETEKIIEDFNQKKKELENEYETKEKNLETFYNDLNEELKEEFDTKTKELENSFEEKTKELEEDFAQKTKNLEDRTKELEEEHLAKQAFLDDYQVELEETNNNKYKELMGKVEEAKNNFESFMKTQKDLFEEEIKLKNEELDKDYNDLNKKLLEKEEEINKDYNEKLQGLKQNELDILSKEVDLNERINKYNEDLKLFNDTKEKFIKRHYISRRIYKYFHKNKFKMIGLCVFLLCIVFYFLFVFEYNISKSNFISQSIANRKLDDSYSDTFTISLDTSKSSLARFTSLNGLTLKLNYNFNKKYFENYNHYTLIEGNNTYTWERFYKDDTMIAKSPFYGQYIIIEDFKDKGYEFKKDEEIEVFIEAFRKHLARISTFEYSAVNRLNVQNKNSFFDYIKQILILSSNYEYYYTFSNRKDGNSLFKEMFKVLLDSENFESFEKEEKDIQEMLKYTDALAGSKEILRNIVNYSKVNNVTTNVKILEGNKIGVIDIYFELLYQDETMVSSIPLSIRVSYQFDLPETESSLEQQKFTMNAVFYEALFEIGKEMEANKNK